MKKYLIFLTWSIFFSPFVHAELKGEIRDNFLSSCREACYESQRANSVNKSFSNKDLKQYCNCYCTYMSNAMNNDLVLSIERGEQQIPPNLPEMSSGFCQKNFKKY
jgi:hypothetical protein